MPITKTRQNWNVGQVVKVGFMTLTVTELVLTPKDSMPDYYLLKSSNGTEYMFQPYYGLSRVI
jgi:hypothetical protein